MRIYIDESGTHGKQWLVIGMLFVPDHGPLHSALCDAKDQLKYFNNSKRHKATYKEIHLTKFKSRLDLNVAETWIDLFLIHNCYFRSMAIDWSLWDGKYFGDPFESESMKQRRAYKKWAEMLIQPELRTSEGEPRFYHAKLYLDHLQALRGYDILDHLQSRFTANYFGQSPFIDSFQHTESWKDANQCLQLCDLLTGCIFQRLIPSTNAFKTGARDYLEKVLVAHRIEQLGPCFWRQFSAKTLNRQFPKFSTRFWKPIDKRSTNTRKRRKRRR